MKKKNVILEHKKESTLKNLISIKGKLGYKQIGEIKSWRNFSSVDSKRNQKLFVKNVWQLVRNCGKMNIS